MTDPAKLADEIERRAAAYGTDFPVTLTQRGARLVAAALRLADKIDRENRNLWTGTPHRMHGKAGDPEGEAMLAAYRAAKEEA